MNDEIRQALEKRLGAVHARQRLGIEQDSEPRVFGGGLNFFHPENWYSIHALIRYTLKISGFYWLGRSNSLKHQLVHNDIKIPYLPQSFDGFTLLHLSDLHVDMSTAATLALINKIKSLEYDACILTGDYRAKTNGPIEAAVHGMLDLFEHLKSPVYAVLGNHDSIRMVPELEQAGIQFLINEAIEIKQQDQSIYLAGIDDAHYYRVDNIEKAAEQIPADKISIIMSHTPEVYRQAAHAGFDLLFCGHTHGGQICLPGGIPVTLDAKCPRRMGSGTWQYGNLTGYTSRGAGTCIVDVRLNCPPEITLHTLRCA
jgi:predicted MPP superfamily phosphohydrolase